MREVDEETQPKKMKKKELDQENEEEQEEREEGGDSSSAVHLDENEKQIFDMLCNCVRDLNLNLSEISTYL